MTKENIPQALRGLKPKYKAESFLLLGLFGSYDRDEATESGDIDILIDTKKEFLDKYQGFQTFTKFDEIKEKPKVLLHKEINFADRQGLFQCGMTILSARLFMYSNGRRG